MQQILKKISDHADALHSAFLGSCITITMSSSDKYVIFLQVLLSSIVKNRNCKDNYDIVILSDGITVVHQNQLLHKFKDDSISIRFIDVAHWFDDLSFYTASHITKTTYFRLIIIDLFQNFDKVIYLDCDTIVNVDIAKLYEIDVSGYMLAGVRDSIMNGWCHMEDANGKQQYLYIKNELGILKSEYYFNAGVLVINVKEFKERGYSASKLLNLAIRRPWKWFDQDVLNLVCKDYVKFIDPRWNVMVHAYRDIRAISEYYLPPRAKREYFHSVEDPYIIHFAGNVIPVNTPCVTCNKIFWRYARGSGAYCRLIFKLGLNLLKREYFKIRQIMKRGRK